MTFGVKSTASGAQLKFARNKATLAADSFYDGSNDVEKQISTTRPDDKIATEKSSVDSSAQTEKGLIQNTSVFTWRDLTYTVKTSGGDRVLLDSVNGFIKPGTLGALMGSSGAGKVSLSDRL